jgi:hypothetical protein
MADPTVSVSESELPEIQSITTAKISRGKVNENAHPINSISMIGAPPKKML